MDGREIQNLYDACRSPDARARASGFRALGVLLHRIAWRQVKDDPPLEHLAEDCMQEALVIVWRQLEAGRGPDQPEKFVSWATTIVVNKVREAIRRLNPRPEVRRAKRVAQHRITSLDAPGRDDRTLAQVLADEDASVEEAAARNAVVDLIGEIGSIEAISEASRFVLIKGFIEGWDDDELAQALGTTKSNVHVIRCRDLTKLRASEGFVDRLRGLT